MDAESRGVEFKPGGSCYTERYCDLGGGGSLRRVFGVGGNHGKLNGYARAFTQLALN